MMSMVQEALFFSKGCVILNLEDILSAKIVQFYYILVTR